MSKHKPSKEKERFWLAAAEDSLGGPNMSVILLNAASHRERMQSARAAMMQRLSMVKDDIGIAKVLWWSITELGGGGLSRGEVKATLKFALRESGNANTLKYFLRAYEADRVFGTLYWRVSDETREVFNLSLVEDSETGVWRIREDIAAQITTVIQEFDAGLIDEQELRRRAKKIASR